MQFAGVQARLKRCSADLRMSLSDPVLSLDLEQQKGSQPFSVCKPAQTILAWVKLRCSHRDPSWIDFPATGLGRVGVWGDPGKFQGRNIVDSCGLVCYIMLYCVILWYVIWYDLFVCIIQVSNEQSDRHVICVGFYIVIDITHIKRWRGQSAPGAMGSQS
jgi:hypothetical protein